MRFAVFGRRIDRFIRVSGLFWERPHREEIGEEVYDVEIIIIEAGCKSKEVGRNVGMYYVNVYGCLYFQAQRLLVGHLWNFTPLNCGLTL